MTDDLKQLEQDADGLTIYEYIVNHVEDVEESLPELAEFMKRADLTGQFLASTARFLAAVNRSKFDKYLSAFIEGALERDRERKYIGSLLEAIWGPDYREKSDELCQTDNNFRRIYKRIFPTGI
ncbi:MAG: hypothetical protein J6C81_03415 [Muribaculaceae bacterium]|nr:hypothetical protein [Muribaculaceae bacterium]